MFNLSPTTALPRQLSLPAAAPGPAVVVPGHRATALGRDQLLLTPTGTTPLVAPASAVAALPAGPAAQPGAGDPHIEGLVMPEGAPAPVPGPGLPALAPGDAEAVGPEAQAAEEESMWAKIAADFLREDIILTGMRQFLKLEEQIRNRRFE